ncbi:hypothetical protein ACJ72_04521 [Emergomyces africanus]|uniref:SAP domain-containing protein n=1 Tax=Emergomyces africanus TaxID=1955775 RepID=A0A1B7NWH5_9EURO|nr:hypothetical protein ACJ72_04521 [Emergomyces africanus]
MASAGLDGQELTRVVFLMRSLVIAQLKDILRTENLAVSGVKSVLQHRIIDRLEGLFRAGKVDEYNQLKAVIYALAQPQVPSTPRQSATATQHPQSAPSTYAQQLVPFSLPMTPSHTLSTARLSFKQSPFYSILEPLTPVVECKVRESTRDSVNLKVILTAPNAHRLQNDPSLRVMVYCAADSGLTQYTKCDVAFPHQVELKANLDDVKANLRGLKNKPGSTRPADITSFIRKKSGYVNHVVMTYALTQKKHYVVINLVRKHSVEELVDQLRARKTIAAEQVIREMKNKADDADIVATSAVMSLKCPLSTLRIAVPCRSTICSHNQCFEVCRFVANRTSPSWSLLLYKPLENSQKLPILPTLTNIIRYVDNILKSTPSSLDQVTVEPDGKWHITKDDDNIIRGGNQSPPNDDGDGDLVEIQDSRVVTLKQEPSTVPMGVHRTPSAQPREISSIPSASRPTPNNKRPASQVIDLTISDDDDDDEEPPRPAKRPHMQPSPNQYSRNRYSELTSRASVSNASYGISSQSGSNSPAPNSFYYDTSQIYIPGNFQNLTVQIFFISRKSAPPPSSAVPANQLNSPSGPPNINPPRSVSQMAFDATIPPFNASDPHARFLSASCLDLLLIELVPMAERLAEELSGVDEKLDEEEHREATFYRLETLGFRVGQGLAERFSRDRPRFTDNLDVIKFLCKDFWTILFRKQIDNLKTNHRGVYVLTDNAFRPFTRMSMSNRNEAIAKAQSYLWFPCGIIRGGLSSMGINATVQAESSDLPGATFQIKTVQIAQPPSQLQQQQQQQQLQQLQQLQQPKS